jgi:hypothetical protein
MKTSSGPHEIASQLSESVRHLNRYVGVTILAGIGLIALAWTAQAEVIYTPVHVTLSGDGSIKLDLNHDGITDFTVQALTGNESCSPLGSVVWASVSVTPRTGNGTIAIGGDAAALSMSAEIDSSQSFHKARSLMITAAFDYGPPPCFGDHFSGYWCHGSLTGGKCQGNGYLGVEFGINGSTHYGWAHTTIAATQNFPTPTLVTKLTGFAYETIPGQAIKTGHTSGDADDPTVSPDSTNPEGSGPGASVANPKQAVSLGMVALGAHEIPLWKRKESLGQEGFQLLKYLSITLIEGFRALTPYS